MNDGPWVAVQCESIKTLAGEMRPGQMVELSTDAAWMIANWHCFKASFGWAFGAEHFRAALNDGGCLHLVIHNDHATLHRDRYHPLNDPVSFVLHQVVDAPIQTALVIAGLALMANSRR